MIRSAAHLNLSLEAATKSLVLLKNDQSVLPFSHDRYKVCFPRHRCPKPCQQNLTLQSLHLVQSVVVIGPFADCQSCYFGKYSPRAEFGNAVSVVTGLRAAGVYVSRVVSGCQDGIPCTKYDGSDVASAVQAADLVILAVGLGFGFESEGKDRPTMDLPGKRKTSRLMSWSCSTWKVSA